MADDILGLLQQFEPTAADKKQALYNSLLAAGLGMMGARRGDEMAALGRGGLLGMANYQNILNTKEKAAIDRMQAATMAMNIREKQRQFQDEDAARNANIEFYRLRGMPGVGAQAANQVEQMGPPASMLGDGTNVPQVAAAPTAAQGGPAKQTKFDQYSALSEFLSSKGLVKAAQQAADLAEKYRPKLKETKTLTQNGQRVTVNLYDDGSTQVLPYSPDLEKLHFADNGGAIQGLNSFTAEPVGPAIPKVQSPDSIASNQQSDINSRRTDARMREQNALKLKELEGPDGPMTPEAIKNAAARYNIDGTLPPMGMGTRAGTYRSAILNEAARQANEQGLTGDDIRVNNLQNKADVSALTDLTKRAAQVGAFERNFNKNADIVLEQSKKVDRTGVPIANKWIQAGKRAVAGDPDLSAYDTVIKATVNEYAKIVSGSMGNVALAEGEIKKVENLLAAAQNDKQVQEVINMMKRETKNRIEGFAEERAGIVKGLRRGGGPQADPLGIR